MVNWTKMCLINSDPLRCVGCAKEWVKKPGVNRFDIVCGVAKGLNYLHGDLSYD